MSCEAGSSALARADGMEYQLEFLLERVRQLEAAVESLRDLLEQQQVQGESSWTER